MSTLPTPLRLLARSGLSVAVVAGSFLGLASLVVHQAVPLTSAAFILFVAFASYGVDRAVDGMHSRLGTPGVTHAILSAVLAIAVGLSAWWLMDTRSAVLATLLPVAVAPYRFIKRIRYAKAFYAAFFWATLVLFVGGFVGERQIVQTTCLFVFVFGKALLGLVVCDIKDAQDDARDGVTTFPSGKGIPHTLAMLHALNIGLVVFTFTLVGLGIFPHFMLLAETHALIVALILFTMRGADRTRAFYVSEFGMDGAYALLFSFALLGRHLIGS